MENSNKQMLTLIIILNYIFLHGFINQKELSYILHIFIYRDVKVTEGEMHEAKVVRD